MTSLGNIEATPLAGLTMVDFVTGDILYLTGEAHTIVGVDAQAIMPRQNVLTIVRVTGYTFVRDALPVRQHIGSEVQRSPYSPPVRLLAEETPEGTSTYYANDSLATLARIQVHSQNLATFTFESTQPIRVIPGQTAILDFTDIVGAQQYAHMAPSKPTSLNDDRIRTWTISSADISPEGTQTFDLTMREKPGGLVTGALFAIARKVVEHRPQLAEDFRPAGLTVKLVGIAGRFVLPERPLRQPGLVANQKTSLLWLAGGIGLTPFLSMLSAIVQDRTRDDEWDIVLALSTREPDVLVRLLKAILARACNPKAKMKLEIHVFSNASMHPFSETPTHAQPEFTEVAIVPHAGRIGESFLDEIGDLQNRKCYLCGPEGFERAMLQLLGDRRVAKDTIVRESFGY
jgi:ferredoxin-NADP reductase